VQSYGYKEIIDYLDQHLGLDQAISQIKQRTRNYAKRQLTWFRKDSRINWLDVSDFDSVDQIIERMSAQA
jgi:tRNA dimethylallyltransferase